MSSPISGPVVEPSGYVVLVDPTTRIHFLDWGAPPGATGSAAWPVLLIHGLAGTAWTWAPVARRLAGGRHVIALDLRGHGLSDAPTDGYGPEDLVGDALAVAEGVDWLGKPLDCIVVAGHGFGAMVAAGLARLLGQRCAGLVLVDGGWEEIGATTGLEPDELLRSLEEPPEVLGSMAAYLADRAAFDQATWDADQERAARAAVVELPAGRVVSTTRPHVLAACVDAMFSHRPVEVLGAVRAPIRALVAADDENGNRRRSLAAVQTALRTAGRAAIVTIDLPFDGHNLMRYRPDDVTGAIEEVDRSAAGFAAHPPDAAYHHGP